MLFRRRQNWLRNGRTGGLFGLSSTFGMTYMLKLGHIVDDFGLFR